MGTIPWGQVGPGALVAFFVMLVFTGMLVPRKTLKASEEREREWKSLALEGQRQNGELISQVRDLTGAAQSSKAMVQAVTDLANERRRGDVEPKDLAT